jgi:methylase of polypeptide subunit release factors
MVNAEPLLALLGLLETRGYDFVPPTPATHGRVIARPEKARARDLRDVFGWSLPFDSIEPRVLDLMRQGEILEATPAGFRSLLRVARLNGHLYLHSAYPTTAKDAVFLGPDSYRFADLLRSRAGRAQRIADMGAGTGVGALSVGCEDAERVLTDINPAALCLARINAAHAGREVTTVQGEGLAGAEGDFDLILANPPYMADENDRDYRDGGGQHGAGLSIRWAREAVARLRPGGRFLLYSGSAIVEGGDALKAALETIDGVRLDYSEIDPDVFGEELDRPAYRDVERIAVIGAVLTRL